jgi:cholesterol transport system auxiliary component
VRVYRGGPALIACFMFFSGCTLFSPVNIDTKKNVLDNIPVDLPRETTHSATLLVLTPETMPPYATTQVAYSTQAYQIAYFSKNEWAEAPSQMIQPLIVQTLRNTHYFSEVLSSPYFGHHTFELRIEILEPRQDFASEPAMLQLAMRISLCRDATNQVVAIKELSVSQPMSERTPYAGVRFVKIRVFANGHSAGHRVDRGGKRSGRFRLEPFAQAHLRHRTAPTAAVSHSRLHRDSQSASPFAFRLS